MPIRQPFVQTRRCCSAALPPSRFARNTQRASFSRRFIANFQTDSILSLGFLSVSLARLSITVQLCPGVLPASAIRTKPLRKTALLNATPFCADFRNHFRETLGLAVALEIEIQLTTRAFFCFHFKLLFSCSISLILFLPAFYRSPAFPPRLARAPCHTRDRQPVGPSTLESSSPPPQNLYFGLSISF